MHCNERTVLSVLQADCILHNFIRSIHLNRVPWLRISGDVPPLSLYAFMMYVRKTVPLLFFKDGKSSSPTQWSVLQQVPEV
jgi:hypothetical protein